MIFTEMHAPRSFYASFVCTVLMCVCAVCIPFLPCDRTNIILNMRIENVRIYQRHMFARSTLITCGIYVMRVLHMRRL